VVARAAKSFGLVVVVCCERPEGRVPAWAIVHDGVADLAAAWRRQVGAPAGATSGIR
jgi:hypothetical protein